MKRNDIMTAVATYSGIVKKGKIQSPAATELPEGSQVIVLPVAQWDESVLVDPHIARRKANGWLVSYVGSVIAQQPQLMQVDGRLLWRFTAFLATMGHPLRGPVGFVDVDAYSGEVLTIENDAEEMINNATHIANSEPTTNS